jgi:radical SAM-linked protein
VKVQRLRVTFSRGDELKYITHLDMMRFWERALRRADVPVFYSEGFSPHAQIALAAPLPVGTTSECEILDVFLQRAIAPKAFIQQVAPQLPAAVCISRVEEIGLTLPAAQADTRAAEWLVDVPARDGVDPRDVIAFFLARDTVPWEHKREDEMRSYDIRALVFELECVPSPEPGTARIRMLLRNDSNGSGRPDQVAAALGLPPPVRIHRTKLVLAGQSPARNAYRKRGRFVS